MKFKSTKQRQAVMASLNSNKSKTDKFQDRMKKTRDIKEEREFCGWKTHNEDKYVKGDKEIIIDKLDNRYDVLVYENSDEDGDIIFSSPNHKEAQQMAKEYMSKEANEIKSKDNFKDKKEFSDKDVNLVKRRLNDGKIKNQNEIFGNAEGNFTNKELTKEQQQKGKEYLIDQWKTPNGVERKNNPMRYREQEILTNFDRIELKEYHDISRYGQKSYYVPLYQVYSKDGDSMEYYVDSNGVNIVG